jgi:hypothetical protein
MSFPNPPLQVGVPEVTIADLFVGTPRTRTIGFPTDVLRNTYGFVRKLQGNPRVWSSFSLLKLLGSGLINPEFSDNSSNFARNRFLEIIKQWHQHSRSNLPAFEQTTPGIRDVSPSRNGTTGGGIAFFWEIGLRVPNFGHIQADLGYIGITIDIEHKHKQRLVKNIIQYHFSPDWFILKSSLTSGFWNRQICAPRADACWSNPNEQIVLILLKWGIPCLVGTSHFKSFQIHVSGVLKMSLHNM